MSQSHFKPPNGEHLRQIGRDPNMSDEEHAAFVERIRRYNMGLDTVSPYPPVKRPEAKEQSPDASKTSPSESSE